MAEGLGFEPRGPCGPTVFKTAPINLSGTPRGRRGGTRTHDLLLPKQSRYQLRYSPFEMASPARTLTCISGRSPVVCSSEHWLALVRHSGSSSRCFVRLTYGQDMKNHCAVFPAVIRFVLSVPRRAPAIARPLNESPP